MIGPVELVVAILAVWRITHLLNAEDGPADLLVRFRRRLGSGLVGQAIQCFYCLSLWLAAPVACLLASSWFARFLLWLGLSGGAILIEEFIRSRQPVAVQYYEEKEDKP